MITTTLGLVIDTVLQFPLELYYGTAVTHTTETYSIHPGETTTSFTFYVETESHGWLPLGVVPAIGIPALFYFGCLSIIGFLRWAIRKNRPPREISQNKYDDKTYLRLKKMQEMSRNRKPTPTILLVVFVILFFNFGRNGLFGLGMESAANKEAIEFSPTHLVYAGNGQGTGAIWMIEEDRKGAGYRSNNDPNEAFDSIVYTIRLFQPESEEQEPIDQFMVSKEMSTFDPFCHNGLIWLTARPNLLRAYDQRSKTVVYRSVDDFSAQYTELKSGIHKLYRHQYNGGDVLRMETLDGGLYYYHFETDKIVTKLSELDTDKSFQRFTLKSTNGKRYQLAVADMDQRLQFNNNLKLSEALEKKEMIVMQVFVKYDLQDSVFFISPELLAQSDDQAFVLHQEDIRKNSLQMISGLDDSANILWSVMSSDFPSKEKEEDLPPNRSISAQLDGNYLIVHFVENWQAAGMMAIHSKSGKILWKYNYSDFAGSVSDFSAQVEGD